MSSSSSMTSKEYDTVDLRKTLTKILLMLSIETMSLSKKEYGCVDLPAEVLYQIFCRLQSLKPVHKLRCVSKLWNSLLSEPSFVNKIYNSLTGTPWIFMYDPTDHQEQIYLNDYHKFIIHHDGLSFKFLNLEKVCFWDSCSNGLVLYYAAPAQEIYNNSEFYVCNPLTKQWVALPHYRPCGPGQCAQTIKLVCDTSSAAASLGQSTCNYKVVVFWVTGKLLNNLSFQIFSSDTGQWKTFPSPIGISRYVKMVFRHGVLYWTNYVKAREILAYSTLENNGDGSERCRSIGFPTLQSDQTHIRLDRCVFGESEGSIYYGYVNQKYYCRAFLSVWMLEDDYTNGGLNWRMVQNNIELKGYRSSKIEVIYFNPVDRNVIIIVDRGCCLAYNIKNLTHEVLHGCPIPWDVTEHNSLPILITPKPTVMEEFVEELPNSSVLQAHNEVRTDTSSSKGARKNSGRQGDKLKTVGTSSFNRFDILSQIEE